MKKIGLCIALAFGMGFSAPATKLSGKIVYLHRQFVDGGHANGFNALKALLQSNAATYGYTLEISENPLTADGINTLFGRLYKGDGSKPAAPIKPIDVLIFSQGEGDWNVSGNPVLAGADQRMQQVNAHVRGGGGLIITHAAAGREISRAGWTFGAKLMTDWFQDEYFATSAAGQGGNQGHYSSGTPATTTFDEETLPTKDSSAYFVRNLMLLEKAKFGYAMPLQTDQVRGEWYHFNGGYKYEGKLGGTVINNRNTFQPSEVRGNLGFPDTGIGPSKIFTVLTKIQPTGAPVYTPPGKGRVSVWGREVSKGTFDAAKHNENGRFVYFNPGHAGDEYTLAGGWMGNLYLSMLRWVVKDDRGCTTPTASNYNSLATVNDGNCIPSSIGHDAMLEDAGLNLGRISVQSSGLTVDIAQGGSHSVAVTNLEGKTVFSRSGNGTASYTAPNLQRGFYMVRVSGQGKNFLKKVSIF